MHQNIIGKNVRITKNVREHIANKMQNIKIHADRIIDANIICDYMHGEYTVQGTIAFGKKVFHDKEKEKDLYVAIDAMFQKIEREIRKSKERNIDKSQRAVVDKSMQNDEEDDARKRNATSIYLNNINFKADKEFIRQTAVNCKLKRSKTKFRQSSQKLLPEERLKRAQEYLRENGIMSVSDYCRITGLLHNSAAIELRKWREMPETGIDTKGRGTHKVYILKN